MILSDVGFLDEHLHDYLRHTGPAMSPFNAWVLVKSLETLPLRVSQHVANATAIADALAEHPKLARVIYPGRDDHPQAAIARRQMAHGGTLVGFEVKGGRDAAFRFANALNLIAISNNLGDAKSLITHPATTTHHRLPTAEKAALGITPGFLRLSVGLEDAGDLIADIDWALREV